MELKTIDGGQAFDFGKTSAQYAAYRDIYPERLYERLRALGVAAPGTSWLDLGTGTGVLPKHLYRPDVQVTGVDISAEQIAFARAEAAENGWDIRYLVSPAETTGLPDGGFDAVTAAQCFFYFDRDAMRQELKRLLKPDGVFIKIFMDWNKNDPVAGQSSALVRHYNPAWQSGKTAREDMFDDLFPGRQTETFTAELPFTRESWHGRMRACRGTLASMDERTAMVWEAEHLRFLQSCPEAFTVKHCILISVFRMDEM